MLDGLMVSNGLAWTPDGSLASYVHTPAGRVDVVDHDTATGLTGRRSFVEPADGERPDGRPVDAEGGL